MADSPPFLGWLAFFVCAVDLPFPLLAAGLALRGLKPCAIAMA